MVLRHISLQIQTKLDSGTRCHRVDASVILLMLVKWAGGFIEWVDGFVEWVSFVIIHPCISGSRIKYVIAHHV